MNLSVRKTFHAPDGKGHAIAIFSLHMTRLHPLASKIKLALLGIFVLHRSFYFCARDMTSSASMMSARKSVNLEELLFNTVFRICRVPLVYQPYSTNNFSDGSQKVRDSLLDSTTFSVVL